MLPDSQIRIVQQTPSELLAYDPPYYVFGAVFIAFGIFVMAVMLVVTALVAWQSFKYVERIYALGAVSDIAHIPTWIPHSAIAISFAAMALIVLLRGLQRITGNGQPPVHNEPERAGS